MQVLLSETCGEASPSCDLYGTSSGWWVILPWRLGTMHEFTGTWAPRRNAGSWHEKAPMQVSCSVVRTTASDPHALGCGECGEQRGPDLNHSTTSHRGVGEFVRRVQSLKNRITDHGAAVHYRARILKEQISFNRIASEIVLYVFPGVVHSCTMSVANILKERLSNVSPARLYLSLALVSRSACAIACERVIAARNELQASFCRRRLPKTRGEF